MSKSISLFIRFFLALVYLSVLFFAAFDTTSADLKINEQTWLPLVASIGPTMSNQNATGISKIANSVVIPLADQGISVYPLSTYRTDYVLVSCCAIFTVCLEAIINISKFIIRVNLEWKLAMETLPDFTKKS